MRFDRQSGLFAHLTSLPGPRGIGTLGAPARGFVDFLARADQSLWAFCPTGPTAPVHGNSPYSSTSAFAGSPWLVDLDDLRERGWLTAGDLEPVPDFPDERVDYEGVIAYKRPRLRTAFERFEADGDGDEHEAFEAFREREAGWLDDYALFAALKDRFDGRAWTEWPAPVRDRDPDALARHRDELSAEVDYRTFRQFCFERQWRALRAYAADRGVGLVGDVPIYVAHDSADVWANPEVFRLDEAGRPRYVAGVPDAEGEPFPAQRWGMPVFDWDHLRETGFDWWIRRLDRTFDRVDLARVDHFKGFERYWAIPADEPDPNVGEWVDVPSDAFFEALGDAFGDLPLFAEDVGHITAETVALRERYGFPGMVVLPFVADWCDGDDDRLPHAYPRDSVAYTSTHDTDTLVGYYRGRDDEQRACLDDYLERYLDAPPGDPRDRSSGWFDGRDRNGTDDRSDEPPTDGDAGPDVDTDAGAADRRTAALLVEAVWASDSVVALAQVQDVLGLGSDARFNVPGTTDGNWAWRIGTGHLTDVDADRLATSTARHDR